MYSKNRTFARLKRIVIVSGMSILSQQAFGQTGVASAEEKLAADSDYVNCLVAQARLLDDGKSDAGTIGSSVALQCYLQLLKEEKVYTQGQISDVAQGVISNIEKSQVTEATSVVLQIRASKRK